MTALEFIKLKQKSWAERKGFILLPGTIANEDGDKIYFDDYNKNLYAKLSEDNKNAYNKGLGGEIRDTTTRRAPMKATFSSSAIVVNLFQYWQNQEINRTPLLIALGLINDNDKVGNVKINFEEKLQIKYEDGKIIKNVKFGTPNLDVMIEFDDKVIAIESKFTEPYTNTKKRNKNSHIQDSYTKKSLWKEIPHIEKLANAIHAQNYQIENCEIKESIEVLRKTKRLDAAQLIKHILGLRTDDDKEILKNKEIILLYLWYDVPNSEEAKEHQEEIEAFASIAKADGIDFHHITYQKVISYLEENYKNEHEDYIKYLVERYSKDPSTL